MRELKKKYGPETKIGAPPHDSPTRPRSPISTSPSALIEREPVTIVVSEKGWIRALKGHVADLRALQFKGDDALRRVLLRRDDLENSRPRDGMAGSSRSKPAKLPGGRGAGRAVAAYGRHRRGRDDHRGVPLCAGRENAGGGERRTRLHRRAGRDDRGHAQGQGAARRREARDARRSSYRPRAIMSRPSARTASFWCSRWIRCRKWRAARACGCRRYRDGGIADAKVFWLKDGLTWKDSAGRGVHGRRCGSARMDRQSRRGGEAAAKRVSEE